MALEKRKLPLMKKASPVWRRLLSAGLVLGGLGYLVHVTYQMAKDVDWGRFSAEPSTLILIIGLFGLSMTAQYFCWMWVVNRNEKTTPFFDGYFAFSAALISRYLPAGKIVQLVGMHQFTTRSDQRMNATYSLMLVTVVSFASGFLAALAGCGSIVHQPVGLIAIATLVVASTIFGLHQGWAFKILGKVFPKYAALGEGYRIKIGLLLRVLVTVFLFCWVSDGVCCLLSLSMLGSSIPWKELPFVLSAHFVSILGGAATIIVPTGIGVRDGIFIALLKTRFPASQAIWMALVVRFCGILGELAFLIPFAFQKKRLASLGTPSGQKGSGFEEFPDAGQVGERMKV